MSERAQKQLEPEAKFAPCPCGEVPTDLVITAPQRARYGSVQGNCCATWSMEFKIGFPKDQADLQLRAMEAWNEAPRKGPPPHIGD